MFYHSFFAWLSLVLRLSSLTSNNVQNCHQDLEAFQELTFTLQKLLWETYRYIIISLHRQGISSHSIVLVQSEHSGFNSRRVKNKLYFVALSLPPMQTVKAYWQNQYHGCWCPGSLRRHGISNRGIALAPAGLKQIAFCGLFLSHPCRPSRLIGGMAGQCLMANQSIGTRTFHRLHAFRQASDRWHSALNGFLVFSKTVDDLQTTFFLVNCLESKLLNWFKFHRSLPLSVEFV